MKSMPCLYRFIMMMLNLQLSRQRMLNDRHQGLAMEVLEIEVMPRIQLQWVGYPLELTRLAAVSIVAVEICSASIIA